MKMLLALLFLSSFVLKADETRVNPMEWVKEGNRQNVVIGFGAPLVLSVSGKVEKAHNVLVNEIAKIDPDGEDAAGFRMVLTGLSDVGKNQKVKVGMIGYRNLAPGLFHYYYSVRIKGGFILVVYRFQLFDGDIDFLSMRVISDPLIYEKVLTDATLFTDSISLTPNS